MKLLYLIIAVVFGAIGFAIVLQITGTYNILGTIQGAIPQINLGQLIQNPMGLIGIAGSVLTTAGVAYAGIKKLMSIKREAEIKISQASQQVQKLTSDVESITKDKEAIEKIVTDKEATISKLEGSLEGSTKEIDKLKAQLQQVTKEKAELSTIMKYIDGKVELQTEPEPIP